MSIPNYRVNLTAWGDRVNAMGSAASRRELLPLGKVQTERQLKPGSERFEPSTEEKCKVDADSAIA